MLLAPALWNGFPLLQFDTGGYFARWHEGRLWLLNSGTGEFGCVDFSAGRFEPVAFCAGYARGLCFIDGFAVVYSPNTGVILDVTAVFGH